MIKLILEKGDLELTTAERKEAVNKKRAEVVTYIHKNFTDAKDMPIPIIRIETAIDQAKLHFDAEIPSEKQAMDAVKKIILLIPMKKTMMTGVLTLSHIQIGKGEPVIKKNAKILRESYTEDGCEYQFEVSSGDYQNFLSELGKATDGDYNLSLNKEDLSSSSETTKKSNKKVGGKKKLKE